MGVVDCWRRGRILIRGVGAQVVRAEVRAVVLLGGGGDRVGLAKREGFKAGSRMGLVVASMGMARTGGRVRAEAR